MDIVKSYALKSNVVMATVIPKFSRDYSLFVLTGGSVTAYMLT